MERNFIYEERQKFRISCSKLRQLVPARDEESRKTLNGLLDELNSLDYTIPGVIDEDVGQLLCHACRLVPLQDNLLVTKVCQLIVIITHQKVKLSRPSTCALMEFVIGVSKQCVPWMLPDTLRALGAVLYENGPKCETFFEELLMPSPPGLLQQTVKSQDNEVRRNAILCVANACMKSDEGEVISENLLSQCCEVIVSALHAPKPVGCDDYTHVRILLGVLRGLQNMLSAQKNIHLEHLGQILAALKSFSMYGLPGIGTNLQIPSTLFPSPLYQASPSPSRSKQSQVDDEGGGTVPEGRGSQDGTPKASGGKKSKKRGGKRQQEKEQMKQSERQTDISGGSRGVKSSDGAVPIEGSSNTDPYSFWPSWGRVSSSESEYSDSEGGQLSKLRSAASKVRQAALGCLLSVIKNTDKREMFGYWSAFLPDSTPGPRSQTLFTCMLNDPAPKSRVASVTVLLALLDGSKQFLFAANDKVQKKTAFTPFSFTLACTIKEIHRSLLLALAAESFHATITQIIKCLSSLACNVSYNNLEPGLLTRIMKAIKPFFYHRDSNVRTACLTCLGAVLAASPPLDEVTLLIRSTELPRTSGSGTVIARPPVGEREMERGSWRRKEGQDSSPVTLRKSETVSSWRNLTTKTATYENTDPKQSSQNDNNDGTASQSDSNEAQTQSQTDFEKTVQRVSLLTVGNDVNVQEVNSSENENPSLPSTSLASSSSSSSSSSAAAAAGTAPPPPQAPDGGDSRLATGTSWLVRMCSDVCLPADKPEYATMNPAERPSMDSLPVRIESLQVLTQLVRGYFHVVRGVLSEVCQIITECMADRDMQINLHSLKVLEEIGKAMLEQLDPETFKTSNIKLETPLAVHEALEVWKRMLCGPLPRILQDHSNTVLQSCACDCLSTIGSQVFDMLELRHRALCITLLLGLSNQDDYRVKAASVRALGVFVMYPCLRQDVLFVADTANAILNSLQDSSVNVRMRATWSLGNLSDAMLINLESDADSFVNEFSDLLLQRLFEAAIAASSDHDKVKSNAVRALGMLVRFIQPQTLAKSSFPVLIEKGVHALLKNINGGAVKVRWNACYALSNIFQNPHLNLGSTPWSVDVYRSLIKVITECKNFKVRINGALALSVPKTRSDYGPVSQFIAIWSCLVTAMRVIGDISDISELKYRDTLRDQLCETIIHLALLTQAEDLTPLHPVIKDDIEMLQFNLQRHLKTVAMVTSNQQTSQKTSQDTPAVIKNHLASLEQQAALLDCQASDVVKMLQQVFVTMTTEMLADESTDPDSLGRGRAIPLD